jgi:hypothetical protein
MKLFSIYSTLGRGVFDLSIVLFCLSRLIGFVLFAAIYSLLTISFKSDSFYRLILLFL